MHMHSITQPIRFVAAVLALVALTACGGGGGGPVDSTPPVSPKVGIVGDSSGPELADFLSSKGLVVDNVVGTPDSILPRISGDFVVWQDDRNGNNDIFAYQISMGQELQVTSDLSDQFDPQIDGDYIVWQDLRNGNLDIFAYRISTGEEIQLTSDPSLQTAPRIDGDYIIWQDIQNGLNARAIFAYRISTGQVIPVTSDSLRASHQIDGDIIVWFRLLSREIFVYRISTEEVIIRVDPIQFSGEVPRPQVKGDIIVWHDPRNGNQDIFYYRVSTQEEIPVTTAASNQRDPQTDGDYIVWQDFRNGNWDIYAYKISTGEEIELTTDPASQTRPQIDGDYIVWEDSRNGNNDIFAYRISTGEEIELTTDPSDQSSPRIEGDKIVWSDRRNGYQDVFLSDDFGVTQQIISTGEKALSNLIANVSDYALLLFGDDLDSESVLPLFDAADAEGINLLGIGSFDSGVPLGGVLSTDGRFGLSDSDSCCVSPMEIDVTPVGFSHPIFEGLDTANTLVLEALDASARDEQVYFTNPADPNSPVDWTILAQMGTNMDLAGDPTIVMFSTLNGTKVILDGSANTADGYVFWTDARWQLFYNEVIYLMQN